MIVEKFLYESCAMMGRLVKTYPEETKEILTEEKKIHLQRFLGAYLCCVSSLNHTKIKISQIDPMKS